MDTSQQSRAAPQIAATGNRILPFPNPGSAYDSLPVVDISKLFDRNPSVQRKASDRIGEVAMENGFLYIQNHGVSANLIDAVYMQSRQFFNQKLRQKNRYYIGRSSNHRGYVPTTEKGAYGDEQGPRRYEAFDLGLDHTSDNYAQQNNIPLLGPNVWPDQTGFKKTVTQYLREMQRITQTMCKAFERVLELPEGFFTHHMHNPMSQLRLLHFLDNTNSAGGNQGVNMGAHTDYELFTILHSRSRGLEIFDLNSNWIAAPPIDNTFYFNIGDMLEAWSGGLFVSTPHRVVNNEERYSMPFFAATNYNTIVNSIHCEKYSAQQREYAPIVAGEHLVSQLLRDFPYLRKRHASGKIPLQNIYQQGNPFEQRLSATV